MASRRTAMTTTDVASRVLRLCGRPAGIHRLPPTQPVNAAFFRPPHPPPPVYPLLVGRRPRIQLPDRRERCTVLPCALAVPVLRHPQTLSPPCDIHRFDKAFMPSWSPGEQKQQGQPEGQTAPCAGMPLLSPGLAVSACAWRRYGHRPQCAPSCYTGSRFIGLSAASLPASPTGRSFRHLPALLSVSPRPRPAGSAGGGKSVRHWKCSYNRTDLPSEPANHTGRRTPGVDDCLASISGLNRRITQEEERLSVSLLSDSGDLSGG